MTEEIKISKKAIWIILIVIVLIGFFFFFRGGSSETEVVLTGNIGSQVGDIAHDFSIIDVDNNQVFLRQVKGKPIVLAFFATWCIPCQIEAERIKQLDDETGGDKFAVYQIGVDGKETNNDLRQFKSDFGNKDWIVGLGLDVAQQYNVRTLDTTLIIDKEGNIIYRDNGVPASVEELRKHLT